jgi:hypothetical protein
MEWICFRHLNYSTEKTDKEIKLDKENFSWSQSRSCRNVQHSYDTYQARDQSPVVFHGLLYLEVHLYFIHQYQMLRVL